MKDLRRADGTSNPGHRRGIVKITARRDRRQKEVIANEGHEHVAIGRLQSHPRANVGHVHDFQGLRGAMAGASVKDAAAEVAARYGLRRRDVYARALELKREAVS